MLGHFTQLTCSTVLILSATYAHAEDALKKEEVLFKTLIRQCHGSIAKVATDKEQSTIRQLRIRLRMDSFHPGLAAAYIAEDGSKEIGISGGFVLGLQSFITAALMEDTLNKPGLADEYFKYYLSVFNYNNRRFMSVEEFSRCSAKELRSFEDAMERSGLWKALFVGSVYYVVAHEIAHHVQGTVGSVSAKESVGNERAADRWASRRLLDLDLPASVAAAMSLLYLHQLEQSRFSLLELKTHPDSLDRAISAVDMTLPKLRDIYGKPPFNEKPLSSYKKAHESLKELLEGARSRSKESMKDWEAVMNSMSERAQTLFERGDRRGAARLARESSEAAYYVGRCYSEGVGGVSRDLGMAVNYYAIAAAGGSDWGMVYLGDALEKGLGIPKDRKQARHWFMTAAKSGLRYAQYRLDHHDSQ